MNEINEIKKDHKTEVKQAEEPVQTEKDPLKEAKEFSNLFKDFIKPTETKSTEP